MPASLRAHMPRGMVSSSRPYDRPSPAASPAQPENLLAYPHLSRSLPPASPIRDPNTNPDPERDPDTPPDHPGLPTYADYKRIEADYLHSLSPRKRDKALITQAMFDKIWDVLHQPEACTIETPQFRFWVRKMFSLSLPVCVGDGGWGTVRAMGVGTFYPDMASESDAEETDLELERAMGIIQADTSTELFSAVVLHENRPVAIREQLYDLFCYCHVRAGHGGRDKTCAVIRQHYSWVPKELTAQFVKACPTCALKRSGHGHGGAVGVDMGVLVQRRVVGQRERRVHGKPSGAEGMPVVPSSLGSIGWPTTGGPLDPANPEPCGVRERERAWLREREDARTIDPSSLPVSPGPADASASGSRTRSVPSQVPLESCLPSGWSGVPRAMTADASSFHLCDTTNHSVVGTTSFLQPFAVHENNRTRTWNDREPEAKHSPTRTGLPSLASALSNESLNENVNLTGLGPEPAGECLPPVLRPLRLSGPILSDTESDLVPPPSESYLFQIDPVLLSFNYPGLSLSESDSAMPLGLSGTASDLVSSEVLGGKGHRPSHPTEDGICHVVPNFATDVCHLPRCVPSDCIDVERLNMPLNRSMDPSDDDASLERDDVTLDTYPTRARLARSSRRRRRRSETQRQRGSHSRYSPRHDDGPLAMRYRCSPDEVGQEFDGTLSFSIMTDA